MATKEQVKKLAKANPVMARLFMSGLHISSVSAMTLTQRIAFVRKVRNPKATPMPMELTSEFNRPCRKTGFVKSKCKCKLCVIARKAKGTVTGNV